MLLDIRETVRNSKPLKYTIIALISIPFVLVGIGSYFSGGGAAPVAEVGGVEISQQQLDSAVSTQRQRLAQMFGGNLPDELADDTMLRQQALDELVTTQVLRNELEAQRFVVSDETLGKAIRQIPQFQVDGRFDAETYQRFLRSSGMDVASFEQGFRDDSAMQQFQQGVLSTEFNLSAELARQDQLERQERTIDFLRYPLASTMAAIEPDEAEIAAWFDDNADNYRFPERVKLAWLELDAAAIAEGIDITDEQAQTWYEDNRAAYIVPESRNASHILLEVDPDDSDAMAERTAELEAIRARIEGGEDFAAVARESSDDLGSKDIGGSLGEVSRGMMVPEFEQALFALEGEGALSAVVPSQFGVHLIRLDSVIAERGKGFDEVKEEVKNTLRSNEASAEYLELRELMDEAAFNEPDSLQAAASATGLEVQQSDWLDSESDNGPILGVPAVLEAAFSEDVLEQGNNSSLIEVGPEHVVVVRVLEHEAERPKSLDDVREEVLTALKRNIAGEQIDARAHEALAALTAGSSTMTELAAADDTLVLGEGVKLSRQSTEPDPAVVSAVFALPRPSEDVAVRSVEEAANGDRVVVVLNAVSTPDVPPKPPESLAAPSRGRSAFGALVESMRARSAVELSDKALVAPE